MGPDLSRQVIWFPQSFKPSRGLSDLVTNALSFVHLLLVVLFSGARGNSSLFDCCGVRHQQVSLFVAVPGRDNR